MTNAHSFPTAQGYSFKRFVLFNQQHKTQINQLEEKHSWSWDKRTFSTFGKDNMMNRLSKRLPVNFLLMYSFNQLKDLLLQL